MEIPAPQQPGKLARAWCIRCGNRFQYRRVNSRPRCVCDDCKRQREVEREQQQREQLRRVIGDDKWVRAENALATQAQVAAALGLSKEQVEREERKALAKLRQHPDLVKLWLRVREEGIPLRQDEGALLLEWQLGLSEMWETHQKLLRQSPEDAAECEALIQAFYERFRAFLNSKKIR